MPARECSTESGRTSPLGALATNAKQSRKLSGLERHCQALLERPNDTEEPSNETLSSLGLDNVGLERGNVVLNQPTREGQQAARHRQAEWLQRRTPYLALGTCEYIRTQLASSPSPSDGGSVLGSATALCHSGTTPTTSSTQVATTILCIGSFA